MSTVVNATAPPRQGLRHRLLFVLGLVSTALLYRRGVPQQDPDAAPSVHM
ncbi:hypothetical protein ACFO9E_21800 [Streptomyces maoxianensis]|uniref:Uncharacterized protein n=1 Tax=Streptomyces maoxianensis TaxID=1459942 RepID=A0ABV9GBB1_9ACTN